MKKWVYLVFFLSTYIRDFVLTRYLQCGTIMMKLEKSLERDEQMDFNFDWNYVAAGAPYVTISELGLAFNSPAITLLNNPEDVVVGFDKDRLAIGVMDAKGNPDVKSYKFYSRLNHGWIRIGCKDFVKYLSSISGISFSPAKKYLANFDDNKKILYITLDSGKEDNEVEEDD